jgi:hypothetical protein
MNDLVNNTGKSYVEVCLAREAGDRNVRELQNAILEDLDERGMSFEGAAEKHSVSVEMVQNVYFNS